MSRRVEAQRRPVRSETRPIAEATQWLENYRRVWEANFQRLDAVLEEMKAAEPGTVANKGGAHRRRPTKR